MAKAKTGAKKTSAKKASSGNAYTKFVTAQMRAGKSMAQAAAAWRAKTGKPKAKKSSSAKKDNCKPRKKRAPTAWNKFVAQHGGGAGRSLSDIAKLYWSKKGKTSAKTSADRAGAKGKGRGKGRGRRGIARV